MPSPTHRNSRNRYLNTRKGREGGLRLHINIDREWVPVFPHVFRDEGLDRGPSYDVLQTHYVEKRYGPKPLMRLEHKACYEMLFYQAEMGERFHTVEMAQRLAISRHTLTGYFDVLENLYLISRVRNGKSFGRYINIVLRAPKLPKEVEKLGYKLYARVHYKYQGHKSPGFIQAERSRVGAAKWPTMAWDFPTMVKMLRGEETTKDIQEISKALAFALRLCDGPEYDDMPEAEFVEALRVRVHGECKREGYPYTDRLFSAALAIAQLNGWVGRQESSGDEDFIKV